MGRVSENRSRAAKPLCQNALAVQRLCGQQHRTEACVASALSHNPKYIKSRTHHLAGTAAYADRARAVGSSATSMAPNASTSTAVAAAAAAVIALYWRRRYGLPGENHSRPAIAARARAPRCAPRRAPPPRRRGENSHESTTAKKTRPDRRKDRWEAMLDRALPAIVVIRVNYVKPFDGEQAGSAHATGFVVDFDRGPRAARASMRLGFAHFVKRTDLSFQRCKNWPKRLSPRRYRRRVRRGRLVHSPRRRVAATPRLPRG